MLASYRTLHQAAEQALLAITLWHIFRVPLHADKIGVVVPLDSLHNPGAFNGAYPDLVPQFLDRAVRSRGRRRFAESVAGGFLLIQ